ncbi:MAG: tRNA (N6-threonylcarbamoyladenosine(37)-N6)-methyltransferase TrmO, partial [Thermoproteota archaeon]
VRLVKVEDCVLQVEGIDVLDGTPLLDIKPYIPEFDFEGGEGVRIGWLEGKVHLVREKRLSRRRM